MVVFSVLAGGPKNGVEIMNEIESMTNGWWRPSPGSVYPMLERLTEEGLVKKNPDGRYKLTEQASEHMEWSFGPFVKRPRTADAVVVEVGAYVSYLEELSATDSTKMEPLKSKLKELSGRLARLAG
jgi:DNA-binding PadR family transcriptional regulator